MICTVDSDVSLSDDLMWGLVMVLECIAMVIDYRNDH